MQTDVFDLITMFTHDVLQSLLLVCYSVQVVKMKKDKWSKSTIFSKILSNGFTLDWISSKKKHNIKNYLFIKNAIVCKF